MIRKGRSTPANVANKSGGSYEGLVTNICGTLPLATQKPQNLSRAAIGP